MKFLILLSVIFLLGCVQSLSRGVRDDEYELSIRDESPSCIAVTLQEPERQCQYVKDHCSDEDIGYINYIELYYCSLSEIPIVSFIIFIGGLVMFFIGLGLTASDYLCPNLYTLSKFLQLSDNFAGLTLLALGNGAPDVLGTYKAMSLDSGSLAISELFGASLFITTIVIGSMAIVHPFKVPHRSFLRDVGFYLCIVCLIGLSLSILTFSIIICIILVSAYFFYVTVVILDHSYLKTEAARRLKSQRSRGNYSVNSTSPLNFQDDEDDDGNNVYLDTFATLPTIEDLDLTAGSLESRDLRREYTTMMRNDSSTHAPVETGQYGLKVLLKDLSRQSNLNSVHLDNDRPLTAPSVYVTTPGSNKSPNPSDEDIHHRQLSNDDDDLNEDVVLQEERETEIEMQTFLLLASNKNWLSYLKNEDSILVELLAPQFVGFSDFTWFDKIYYIVTFPISLVLRLTNPVRDHSIIAMLDDMKRSESRHALSFSHDSVQSEVNEFDFELDRILLIIQIMLGTNLFCLTHFSGFNNYLTIIFIGFIFSIAISILIWINYKVREFSGYDLFVLKIINNLTSFVGFLISITWISIYATEIIGILKSLAIIYHISDAILGVTVFALGNSIGDLISNYTIAKMGMPIMAFSASFGSPLISLCSLGLSGLIVIPWESFTDNYNFNITGTVIITFISLILNIIFILIAIPRNDWMLDKKIGTILVLNWFIATTICLINEIIS
ncbi:Sodium/calcium exchanger protein-domain-containing protein [Scheffersomyces amazonensis]|uniref:Sodium/calcium exchanger protein-domain-containing protein n=1 Tax=Scheffersomyces amazonensis TaxID=1078765 RepID=UPI00315DBD4B